MKRMMVGLVLALAMMLGAAGPAAALGNVTAADLGLFHGTAKVGKAYVDAVNDSCSKTNLDPALTGGGLGVPVLSGVKTGFWTIDTLAPAVPPPPFPPTPSFLWSALHGWGSLQACGQLGPVLGIGAACGMSTGTNGVGKVNFAGVAGPGLPYSILPKVANKNDSIQLSSVTWPFTIGGTLPITATVETDNAAKTKLGTLVGAVQAQGGGPCTNKTSPAKGAATGATAFEVFGAYVVIPA